MIHQFSDPFHRKLFDKLAPELEKRVVDLSQGSAARSTGSASSVDENYAAQVAYIKALRDVLSTCEELDNPEHPND